MPLPPIDSLGFLYVVAPILINTVVILVVAVLFNFLFKWRRYPSYLTATAKKPLPPTEHYSPISHAEFVYALSQIDSFIDVTAEDLFGIYNLATNRNVNASIGPEGHDT